MLDINLVSFEGDVAGFELYNGDEDEILTCRAVIRESDLSDFMNGEFVIDPSAWFNSEEITIDKPEWFNKKALLVLNVAFEIGYKYIREKMIDDQGGMM